jgi:hypothetical protein
MLTEAMIISAAILATQPITGVCRTGFTCAVTAGFAARAGLAVSGILITVGAGRGGGSATGAATSANCVTVGAAMGATGSGSGAAGAATVATAGSGAGAGGGGGGAGSATGADSATTFSLPGTQLLPHRAQRTERLAATTASGTS